MHHSAIRVASEVYVTEPTASGQHLPLCSICPSGRFFPPKGVMIFQSVTFPWLMNRQWPHQLTGVCFQETLWCSSSVDDVTNWMKVTDSLYVTLMTFKEQMIKKSSTFASINTLWHYHLFVSANQFLKRTQMTLSTPWSCCATLWNSWLHLMYVYIYNYEMIEKRIINDCAIVVVCMLAVWWYRGAWFTKLFQFCSKNG